nr:expressed protein [Hymenolepis microstoma]
MLQQGKVESQDDEESPDQNRNCPLFTSKPANSAQAIIPENNQVIPTSKEKSILIFGPESFYRSKIHACTNETPSQVPEEKKLGSLKCKACGKTFEEIEDREGH